VTLSVPTTTTYWSSPTIENPESLKEHPLEIDINLQLGEKEGILPFVFDGKHVLLGGDASKDEQGRTHITIDHLHELPSDRRGLGGSARTSPSSQASK
jgi:hypothetical protein